MSQHCSTRLGDCVMMKDWHAASPHNRLQQLHTCCLWLRLLGLGMVHSTDVCSACVCVCMCMCTSSVLSRVVHYTLSPEMGLMGCKEKADEPGPKPAYDMSNTWSAMSLVGHIGSVPDPSVSLLTSKCIRNHVTHQYLSLLTGRSGFAFSKLLTQNKCMQLLCKTTKCIKKPV